MQSGDFYFNRSFQKSPFLAGNLAQSLILGQKEAGILTTIFGIIMSFGYFTQIFKMIKRKSSADVSVTTYIIFSIGLSFWLIYGISLNDLPLIISNTIALIGAVSVVITFFKYKK